MNRIFLPVLLCLIGALSSACCAAESAAANLLVNPGFESTLGWQVQMQEGATGSFGFDGAPARSGKQSLRLTKTNGLG